MRHWYLSFLIAWAAVAGAAIAAESNRFDVSVRQAKTDAKPAVGDPVVLELELCYPAGASRPELVRDLPPDVAVLGEDRLDQSVLNGTVRERRRLRLAFFNTGIRRVRSLRYVCRAGEQELEARTGSMTVGIRALRPNNDETLDESEPPWIIPFPAWRLAIVIGAGLAILFAIGLLVWWMRRRRKQRQAPVIPPDLLARDCLHDLAGQDLPRRGHVREFYFRITEIVKDYLGKELGVVVLERTTAEIVDQLPRDDRLTRNVVMLTTRFFQDADRIKFANYPATPKDGDVALQQAFEIIRLVHELVATAPGLNGSVDARVTEVAS